MPKIFFAFIITLFLIGCGSSGGDGTTSAAATTPPVVENPVVITTQPTNVSIRIGETVTISIVAENATKYQWQYSQDNTNWNDDLEGIGPTYSILGKSVINGFHIRCVVSNSSSVAISNSIEITIESTTPVITQQPQDNYCVSGESAYLLIYSTNTTSYQWEYATSVNGPWSRNPGNRFALTQQSFNFVTRTMDNGMVFRCIVTNSATGESVTSNVAHIYVVAAVPQ